MFSVRRVEPRTQTGALSHYKYEITYTIRVGEGENTLDV